MRKILALAFMVLLSIFTGIQVVHAQEDLSYQTPPQVIADLVEAPQTPAVSVNANGDWMLLLHRPGYPSIEELAQPELRLAGIRINPRNNGASRSYSYNGLSIRRVAGTEQYEVQGLPEDPRIQNVRWSPDGQQIAFTLHLMEGIELWIADIRSGEATRLTEAIINDAIGAPYQWLSDSKHILYKSVLSGRGEAPVEALVPEGPVIQETTGQKAPVRTYQDLLSDPHDEALFEYYALAQPYLLNTETQEAKPFAKAGIISQMIPSPEGQYIFTLYIQQPFSYIVPYYRFPQEALVYDRAGNLVEQVAEIPLSENIPKGFGAVRTGPRDFGWRSDQPATLYWVEAQDEGDPANEVEVRDQLFYLPAPFSGDKQPGIRFSLRFGGITWGNEELAISNEYWWSTRELITSAFEPGKPASKTSLFERSFEDRYNDPGSFETTVNQYGEEVLLTDEDGNTLYLTGQGASPDGNRPFVREFDLKTKETNEIWRSEAPYYEYPIRILDISTATFITRRESKDMPPNYFLRDLEADKITSLTEFSHPYPQLDEVEKQVIQYKRADGVDLKGDLYLPIGYDPADGPLPVLMWAYPNEFKSADAASQVEGSPYEFIRLGWYSPLYFLTRGYAIFDDPSMPVVGEGDEEPNDSFRAQLVMNAAAAIDKLVDMGIADRERVAIGGHSYGAFMTANLLAHSDLFAAGIARSGAYNRTLTPFGFQAEERTYWEAPEIYYSMSPFMHADKINEPMLMIHGQADNNSGTFPVQSERMFAALKGLGGKSRLVMLPYESHGYRAKESIMHMLWEMDNLLEQYVKNRSSEKEQLEMKVERD